MKAKLILILLLAFCVDGFYGKGSKFKGFDLKSLENNAHINKENNAPGGPFCSSIVAFYIGTLQNKKSNKSYDVEFQVKLWTDKKKKRIHVEADKWDETFSKSGNFELDYYYEGTRDWCNIYDDECTMAFAKKETNFTLDLNTADGNYFHLLNFNFFNNSFGLNDPIGKCTKHQLAGLNDDYLPNSLFDKLTFCVCCDEYEPTKMLGCPSNEWSNKETTCPTPTPVQCPKYTTPAPLQCPTIPPPVPQNITCKSVVGYYNGMFKNTEHPDTPHNVEFEIRVNADDTKRLVYLYIDKWNEQKSSSSEFTLFASDWESNTRCDPINNSSWSLPYVSWQTDYFLIDLEHYDRTKGLDNDYYFLYFPDFYNAFKLTNAVGQCTKYQWQNLGYDDSRKPNTKYYDYCVCCGDNYNPHPSLNCPTNPWA